MNKFIVFICLLGLFSCASDPQEQQRVAEMEASRMQPPSVKLASFGFFELLPMEISPVLADKPEKVEVGRTLEQKIRAEIEPVLAKWNGATNAGKNTSLEIKPVLIELFVPSTAGRVFGYGGDSYIEVELRLVDKSSGKVIGKPRARRSASAVTGGLTFGASDKNLLDYIAVICREYLVDQYQKS